MTTLESSPSTALFPNALTISYEISSFAEESPQTLASWKKKSHFDSASAEHQYAKRWLGSFMRAISSRWPVAGELRLLSPRWHLPACVSYGE